MEQSFLLGEPTPDEVRAALRQRGVEPAAAAIEQSLDRLMPGYVLMRHDGGRLVCPAPFLGKAIEGERTLQDRLEDDLDAWRADRGRPPQPAGARAASRFHRKIPALAPSAKVQA